MPVTRLLQPRFRTKVFYYFIKSLFYNIGGGGAIFRTIVFF